MVRLFLLAEGRTYWYRAYVILQRGSEIKTFYGKILSFTTLKEEDSPEPPVPDDPPGPVTPPDTPPDTPPGPDNPDIPQTPGSNAIGWYELPLMSLGKSGDYYYNTTDNTQYYAWHMCSGGEMDPGGGWNTLEDWVDGQVCADTLYEVTGCYFDKYTDGYNVTQDPQVISFGGRNDVSMPTMFYYILLRTKTGNSGKALKDCSASELKCTAFVRTHSNSHKGQKVTSREMMRVSDLEKITGVSYFPNVPNAPKGTFSASDWGL